MMRMMRSVLAGLAPALVLILGACGSGSEGVVDGRVQIEAWAHSGQAGERQVLEEQVARFNATHPDIAVNLTVLPEGSYNQQVQAAAAAGELPDLLELDGPFLYRYAWQGQLRSLDALLPEDLRRDLLPSIVAQGTYDGRLYAVGAYDSGLGLWARRSRLRAVGARIPEGPADAWTRAEFEALLNRLADRDEDRAVLDLKLNYRGEWFTYAMTPVLWSAGAHLMAEDPPPRAAGVLDAAAATVALGAVQGWILRGLVDPNLDDAAFTQGRVALSWAGHWEHPRYAEAFGDDLLLLPLPDFGQGSRTGQGSWAWGITQGSPRSEAAAAFVQFLLRPEEILAMTAANGAVPATRTAVARSPLYQPGGPLHLFVVQLTQGYAHPRPRTPGYPIVTSAFQEAFAAIRDGADVQRALDRAVETIDRDQAANRDYEQVADAR